MFFDRLVYTPWNGIIETIIITICIDVGVYDVLAHIFVLR
jgi:hypothetical protein